ncbi:ferritin-like domain-containing protein [Xylariales sp. PMI_506]|nr:ferritin-like domain-containing protein [Xylariales sp. PMI_506]
MYWPSALVCLFCSGLVAAAPVAVQKRVQVTDVDILNYALTLEHLEDVFYREGLAKFTQQDFVNAGFGESFLAELQGVAGDEASHVTFLTGALTAAGAPAVAECTYNFGVTDVKSFVALASVLEGVGVTAYLGAAADIASKGTLTAAGSILTVEARHSALLRQSVAQNPIAQPFDVPLSLNEVFSLASQFIVSCPSTNPALPVKAFPVLSLSSTAAVRAGDTVTLTTPGTTIVEVNGAQVFAAFISVTGPTFVPAVAVNGGFSVQIPQGFAGQSYAVLTLGNQAVTDDNTIAGPSIIEIVA